MPKNLAPITPQDFLSKLLRIQANAYCDALERAMNDRADEGPATTGDFEVPPHLAVASAALGRIAEVVTATLADADKRLEVGEFRSIAAMLGGGDDGFRRRWRMMGQTEDQYAARLDRHGIRSLLGGDVPGYFACRAMSECAAFADPEHVSHEALARAFEQAAMALEASGR